MHRLVTVLILDPETPGGLSASMAWRFVSRSATADDILLTCLQWLEVPREKSHSTFGVDNRLSV